jgi:hypothetical protein
MKLSEIITQQALPAIKKVISLSTLQLRNAVCALGWRKV